MKDTIIGGIAGIIIIIFMIGLFALCGWAIASLLNVVLTQIGLGSINFWGGCCILAIGQIIKFFTHFGNK